MSGWKTWAGAIVMGISAVMQQLGFVELAQTFEAFAFAIIAIGLGHKIEKAKA